MTERLLEYFPAGVYNGTEWVDIDPNQEASLL